MEESSFSKIVSAVSKVQYTNNFDVNTSFKAEGGVKCYKNYHKIKYAYR